MTSNYFFLYDDNNLTILIPKPEHSGITRLTPWLLMPWLRASPGHQHPCYWPCRIKVSLSSKWEDFMHPCNANKYVSLDKFSVTVIKVINKITKYIVAFRDITILHHPLGERCRLPWDRRGVQTPWRHTGSVSRTQVYATIKVCPWPYRQWSYRRCRQYTAPGAGKTTVKSLI